MGEVHRVGLKWRKSSRSAQAATCVELARVADGVVVRDSKRPTGQVLAFGLGEWRAFLVRVKAGAHDLARV
ncbi:DUF397 domain-containing protein [Actinomadura sp. NBRC 104425]|uniref:DUF397 domain-containing protein n=1 Tax=Actinomadura sp. NBRC 104425 TaxID=3032204 RepID=UPI002552773B|nr:DUF397 domain-containing protein [Actinomadura sp. NBRC 104425]